MATRRTYQEAISEQQRAEGARQAAARAGYSTGTTTGTGTGTVAAGTTASPTNQSANVGRRSGGGGMTVEEGWKKWSDNEPVGMLVDKIFGGGDDDKAPAAPAYQPDATAFDVLGQTAVRGLMNQAGNLSQQGFDRQEMADNRLIAGYSAPQIDPLDQARAGVVNPNVGRADTGLMGSGAAMGQALDARGSQLDALRLQQAAAMGEGPSVAPGMLQEAGFRNAGDIQMNAADAAMAYRNAAAAGNNAYGRAFGQQQYSFDQAASDAQRSTMAANEDAIRRSAALTAGARGNMMGAALLNAQNNAAFGTQQAGVTAANNLADQQRAAAFQAQQAQQQAAYNQTLQGLQAADINSRANIASNLQRGVSEAQAAQIASNEQIAARNEFSSGAESLRGMDLNQSGAWNDYAQTGLAADTAVTNVLEGNANRTLNADQFNIGVEADRRGANAGLGMQTNTLNSGNLNQVADRGQSAGFSGFDAQRDIVGSDVQAGMDLEAINSGQYSSAADRRLGAQQSAAAARSQQQGAVIGALGAAGAAYLSSGSDVKLKNVGKDVSHDYRKAQSKKFTYKNPDKYGAGDHEGPMANDLPEAVTFENDDGALSVDIKKLAMSLAGTVGELQRRLDELSGEEDDEEEEAA